MLHKYHRILRNKNSKMAQSTLDHVCKIINTDINVCIYYINHRTRVIVSRDSISPRYRAVVSAGVSALLAVFPARGAVANAPTRRRSASRRSQLRSRPINRTIKAVEVMRIST